MKAIVVGALLGTLVGGLIAAFGTTATAWLLLVVAVVAIGVDARAYVRGRA